jgi:hypothetical protein
MDLLTKELLEELYEEWCRLMEEARQIGLTTMEVRDFIQQLGEVKSET